MKKYILINHYNWDGDWGISQSLVFNTKEEAKIKLTQELGYEIADLKTRGYSVVDATNEPNDFPEKEFQNVEDDLYYVEDFEDTVILAKYGDSSINHEEWTIQEIEIGD